MIPTCSIAAAMIGSRYLVRAISFRSISSSVSLASEFCLIGAESLLDGDQLCPGFGVGFDQLARTFGQLLLYLNELLLLLSLPGG